jgi:hypothetical protein
LIATGPSLWHFDYDSAIRYASEKEARTAANRRASSLAKAVRIVEVDGQLGMELLADPEPERGGWTIVVKDSQLPQRMFYVISAGKTIGLSTEPNQAKAYKREAKAQQVANTLNDAGRFTAEVKQVTAEIIKFPR